MDFSHSEELTGASLPPHVYVHVPFCRSKCSYCDFVSVPRPTTREVSAVFEALRSEIRQWATSALSGVVETFYVGGGTPSLFADETAQLVRFALGQLPMRDGAEVTVEANPDSFGPDTADAWAGAGVTRVSIGAQSFDDFVLDVLGRVHDAAQAASAIDAARRAGLDVSVDLMCGVPGQTLASWQETLDRTVRAKPHHASVYALSLEEGTPLEVAVSSGLVQEPDPDEAATMMVLAEEVLARAGLERYEVANFALAGHECRHNVAYWTGGSYLGVGPAAHGMLDVATAAVLGVVPAAPSTDRTAGSTEEPARIRYRNTDDVDEWLLGTPWEVEALTASEAAREDVMLGLRMTRGVSEALARAAGVTDVLEHLESLGLVEGVAGRWRTTRRGWLLGNEVFGRVWSGE